MITNSVGQTPATVVGQTDQGVIEGLLNKIISRRDGVKLTSHDSFEAIKKLIELKETEALKKCLGNTAVPQYLRLDIVRGLARLKDQSAIEQILTFLKEDLSEEPQPFDRLLTSAWTLETIGVPPESREKVVDVLDGLHYKYCHFDIHGQVRQTIDKIKAN